MSEYLRSLRVYADGEEIAAGCRIAVEGEEKLSLRAGFFLLRIWNLSESGAARLAGASRAEVRSELSVLAWGKPEDVHTAPAEGGRLTEAALGGAVVFLSPAASFYAVLRDLTGEKLLMPAAAPGLQYPGEHGALLASALMAAFSYLAAAGLLLFAAARRLRARSV